MDIPETIVPVTDEKILYKNSTYDVVSKIAYLIGVPKRIFENDYEPPKMEVFEQLEKDKNARIIRHLCILRTAIERGYKQINEKMKFEFKTILTIPECIPMDSVNQLSDDGISFVKRSSTKPKHHVIEINRIISDRINNCKDIFPLWINWQYIRELFIMPNGLTEAGTKEAAVLYYSNLSVYPYQVYINWQPRDAGNILYNDKKFASLLYAWHGDYFAEQSKVSDVGNYIKGSIYYYINSSNKVVVVVDCENSDPYKLCATFKNLDSAYTQKITSIILFDDIHTVEAWKTLEQFTQIPVEHMMVERVKQNKSLVDIKLTARACQEHYRNYVDSFIIVSSDSDYWGLISSMPDARFLVMIEREKCGPDMKNALVESEIFYCYIDDFYSGNAEDIKQIALFRQLNQHLNEALHLNVNIMLDEALQTTRIHMDAAERKQFYEKHIRPMKLVINEDGDVGIELKR